MTHPAPVPTSTRPPRPPKPALPRYLAVIGPTACGKTAAALAIAQRHPVEIISVDSALVYRGMDIGTAKPSAAELACVPHHLINIRDPLHAYSAADFARDALALMHAITARGRLPLLVGGTMLYFKALRDGIDDMPPANPDIRHALEQEAAHKGWPALHAELMLIDPLTAARLAPLDAQRIARALEVYRLTGLPLSHFHTTATTLVASSALSERASSQKDINLSGTNALLISLEPQDRAWLHQRIAQRFDAMLAAGFLDEVKTLRARSDLHLDLPAMRCVGYRQAWEYLDAVDTPRRMKPCRSGAATETPVLFHVKSPTDPSSMADFRDKGIIATRQLAKRQMTWLRSMTDRHVVACDAPDALQQVLALAQQYFSTPS